MSVKKAITKYDTVSYFDTDEFIGEQLNRNICWDEDINHLILSPYIEKSNFIFDKGTDRTLVISNKRKHYSWVEIGSSFLLPELNASYLLPQFNDLKKIVLYRSKLYMRYMYNFNKY